jgi:hypothetical protein
MAMIVAATLNVLLDAVGVVLVTGCCSLEDMSGDCGGGEVNLYRWQLHTGPF